MASRLPAGEGAAGEWPAKEQADLRSQHGKASALKVDALGEPVRSVMSGDPILVPNPDGKTYDLIKFYWKRYGGPNTIVSMDLGTGKVKTADTGRDYTNFHLAPRVLAPNGKLYLSILGDQLQQRVCVYDPATDEFKVDGVKMPAEILGETHPMVLGQDGMIYCSGTHPSGSVTALRIDPATDTVAEFHGPLGLSHAPSPCWAYSMAVCDTHIYIASGKTPWWLVAYDRKAKKAKTLLQNDDPAGYLGVDQNVGGGSAFVRTTREGGGFTDERYWLYRGKAISMTGDKPIPPWPEVADSPEQPRVPELYLGGADPDVNGQAVIWCRTDGDKATAEATAAANAAAAAFTPPPSVAEGQSPVVPTDAEMMVAGWKAFRFEVGIYPLRIDRLVEIPDGRLLGTAGDYQGNFYYDPTTGKAEHPGQCGLSHYATAILDGKIYMSGYPSGVLYGLDPARPWTANKHLDANRIIRETDADSNPRRVTYLKSSGVKKMMAAAATPCRIYFGGIWMREGNWGGLGWWDVATSTEGGLWEPFRNHQIRYMAAADKGRVLVLSTLPVDNARTGEKKAESAALFFFDTTTEALFDETLIPVPKARCAGPVLAVGAHRVMGWTENPDDPKRSSILYGVDATARKLLFTKKLPFAMPIDIGGYQKDPWDFRMGPDGKVWTFIEYRLTRIDPADASLEFLGVIEPGGRMAFAGGDLFLGGKETLRCVRGLLAPVQDPGETSESAY